MNKPNVFEIRVKASWHKTSEDLFRSWGGDRRINGVDYNGPVFQIGTDNVVRAGTDPNRCCLLSESGIS